MSEGFVSRGFGGRRRSTRQARSTKANARATWLRITGTVLSSTCVLGKCYGDHPESPSSTSRHAFAKGR